MTEENILHQRFGRQNPFSVPEGYFEAFAAKMMSQLPEDEPIFSEHADVVEMKPAGVRHSILRYAVAACITGVIVGAAVWFIQPRHNISAEHFSAAPLKASVAAANDDNIEEMADYAMIDNQDIYSYLTDY